jgi:hypothetical protein
MPCTVERSKVRLKGGAVATDRPDDRMLELAERHAAEAERLLKGRWISDHIKA